MLIQHLEVNGFQDRKQSIQFSFESDINIITGYNGAGKTNILKLIWYTISGNIYALLEEIKFTSLQLKTDLYNVHIQKIRNDTCKAVLTDRSGTQTEFEDVTDEDDDFTDARDTLSAHLQAIGSSIFFPTFRRIEGGFTIGGVSRSPNPSLFNAPRVKGDLPEAVAAISRKLTNLNHTFVTSISTIDIAELLLRHFNEMSEEANTLQTKMSQDVINKIRDFRRDTKNEEQFRIGEEAVETLESIRTLIERVDVQRERIMAPMLAVQTLGAKIFKHKGIQINRRVGFGDTVNAISSDLLSAGEKQMLSFICYNAFTDHAPIFIDEPELSLHVDWQRTLFPTLQSQKKENQFIIATHSPFIYGKFPEKEIALVDDRGEG